MAKQLALVDGVECSVETGSGRIKTLDTSRRNWKVEFTADHVQLQKPVSGWLDPGRNGDAPLAAVARDLHERDGRCAYRIVIRRKPGQPTDVPLASIPNDQRVRDVVDVVAIGRNDEVPPDWSGAPIGAPPADAPSPAPAEAHAAAPGAASQPPTVDDDAQPPGPADEPTAAATTSADGKRGPRLAEPKPWEPFQVLAGGETTLNLGSYAVQAVEGMVLLAHDLLLAKAQLDARSEGHALEAPAPARIRALAGRLLLAADRAQAAVRVDGHFDRMSSSHTRSRAAVRAALDVYPVPWDHGGDPDVLRAWVDDLTAYATAILETVVAITETRS